MKEDITYILLAALGLGLGAYLHYTKYPKPQTHLALVDIESPRPQVCFHEEVDAWGQRAISCQDWDSDAVARVAAEYTDVQ